MTKQAFVIATEYNKACVFAETPEELATEIERILNAWRMDVSIDRRGTMTRQTRERATRTKWPRLCPMCGRSLRMTVLTVMKCDYCKHEEHATWGDLAREGGDTS